MIFDRVFDSYDFLIKRQWSENQKSSTDFNLNIVNDVFFKCFEIIWHDQDSDIFDVKCIFDERD